MPKSVSRTSQNAFPSHRQIPAPKRRGEANNSIGSTFAFWKLNKTHPSPFLHISSVSFRSISFDTLSQSHTHTRANNNHPRPRPHPIHCKQKFDRKPFSKLWPHSKIAPSQVCPCHPSVARCSIAVRSATTTTQVGGDTIVGHACIHVGRRLDDG